MNTLRQKFFYVLICLALSSFFYFLISYTTPETHRLSIKINLNFPHEIFRDVLDDPEFSKWWIEQNSDLLKIANVSENQDQDANIETFRAAFKDRFFWVRGDDIQNVILYIEHPPDISVDFIYSRAVQQIEDYYQIKRLQTISRQPELSERLIKNSVILEDISRPTQTQKLYLVFFIFLTLIFSKVIYLVVKKVQKEITDKKTILIRFAPLIAIVSYLCFTIALFYSQILEWPRRYSATLLPAFLICCIFAIVAGFAYEVQKHKKVLNFYKHNIPTFLWVLILMSTLANFIAPYIYTGSTPADFFKFTFRSKVSLCANAIAS